MPIRYKLNHMKSRILIFCLLFLSTYGLKAQSVATLMAKAEGMLMQSVDSSLHYYHLADELAQKELPDSLYSIKNDNLC